MKIKYNINLIVPFLFICLLLSIGQVSGSTLQKQEKDKRLLVGVRVEPPFVMKDSQGSFYGLSVDLWRVIADELNITYDFKEYNYAVDQIRDLSFRKKRIDLCINPLHVSSTRVRQMEVTQPFFISSMGIAMRKSEKTQIEKFLGNIFSWGFFKLILTLLSIVFSFGTLVWWIEKKNNNKDFRHGIDGILDGIWWSTVTITTVGYGDKTPKTTTGRIISMIWMFAAVSLISSFTATMTSTLTVNSLEDNILYLEDINKMGKIGTVANTGSEYYLMSHKIKVRESYENALEGLRALRNEEIDLFVYDQPVIHYTIQGHGLGSEIKILPMKFNTQYFSFIMPKGSKYYTGINPELVDVINTETWEQILKRYNLRTDE